MAKHTRTITWEDPAATASAVAHMDGTQWLEAIQRGELPTSPMWKLMGYKLESFGQGRAVFVMEPGGWLHNGMGTVHGGALSTVADAAMGSAVATSLPPRARFSTLELKINYTAPATAAHGTITAVGAVLHVGRRTATAEARVTSGQSQRLHAHATATFMWWDAGGE